MELLQIKMREQGYKITKDTGEEVLIDGHLEHLILNWKI
jgi:hypothetical protein